MTYKEFLERKIDIAPLSGIEIDPAEVSPALKDHQRVSVLWALRGGRRSIFARFGLGKTVMQLEWCKVCPAWRIALITVRWRASGAF